MGMGYNPEMDRKLVTDVRYRYTVQDAQGIQREKYIDTPRGIEHAQKQAERFAARKNETVVNIWVDSVQPEHLQAGYHPRDQKGV